MLTAILFCSLTVTNAWAQDVAFGDSIPNEVKLSDGTMVKTRTLATRAPSTDETYTYKGVKYTYITENNYTRFFNLDIHKPSDYGWYPDKDGWYVNAEKAYITAASIDVDNFPSSGEVYILNDLVGFFKDHTHLGCIADNGFRYMPGVRRVYFQDCAALSYTANSYFYFFIGDCAFADCENLTEVNLMQWTTSGDNHWEALPLTAVKRVWGSMINNSPKAWIRVGMSKYQEYLGSQTWVQLRNSITTFEHSSDDITADGVIYSFLKAEDGTALSNADEQHEEIMKMLRLWNADYREFNAASLLSDKSFTPDNANIWYTTVKGVDSDFLKSHDGVLRIYNDPGSYYNYKTIAIRKGAFENCDDLKAVEFYQTNGRSENSYSEPKMVIENGAFRNCKNLKEIRLFYMVEDGEDHWRTLGPKDIIPGNNIFGLPTAENIAAMDAAAVDAAWTVNPDFRILVAPDRYAEFKEDPNWIQYIGYLQPADYMPTAKPDIVKDGLTYSYIAKGDGIYNTDQVVTQDVSLWTIPMVAYEVISQCGQAIGSIIKSYAFRIAKDNVTSTLPLVMGKETYKKTVEKTAKVLGDITKGSADPNVISNSGIFEPGTDVAKLGVTISSSLYNKMRAHGLIGSDGRFVENIRDLVVAYLSDSSSPEGSQVIKQFLQLVVANSQSLINENSQNSASAQTNYFANMFLHESGMTAAEQTVYSSLFNNPAFLSAYIGNNMTVSNLLGAQLNAASLKEGMVNNIIANMNQVSTHGLGLVVITPDKNLIYHTYIKSAPEDIQDAVIYTGVSKVTRTTTWLPKVFQNKKQLKTVSFHDNSARTSHNMSANLIYIPDSAFVGCSALERLDLRMKTNDNGQRAMGPENFVLCGNSIFDGLDSQKFKIFIPTERREDFENDLSWGQYKRFFKYEDVEEVTNFTEFGVKYAYTYQNGNQYVEKKSGHTIEHLHAIGPDDDYIKEHNGALGFFNDIGSYNNYKLDYARRNAFRNNANIKSVSFWDVAGWMWTGDAYSDLQMELQDFCFADCPNLEYVDMFYLRTDDLNQAEPLVPTMVQLGKGVFDNSPKVRFKMTDQQIEKFAADSAWAQYKDRFLPCLFQPRDTVVQNRLKDMEYRSDVTRPWYDNDPLPWEDMWYDITRMPSNDYLNGKFSGNTNLRNFPDFKRFELLGLTQVGGSWFQKCENLSGIELPSTIKHIGGWAFYGCSSLKEITIPAAVETIDASAFQYSGLKTVRCEGTTPAKLENNVFDLSNYNGFVIYVPAESVGAYQQAWPNYAQYIKSNADDHKLTEVHVDVPGTLAEKLGLTLIKEDEQVKVVGPYWKYDSLTVSGHLNGLDVIVLRYMAGANSYCDPTDGRLRYLDLHPAYFDKDDENTYNLVYRGVYLKRANSIGDYMFFKCKVLETLILPASVTEIGKYAFWNAMNLRRLFVGEESQSYKNQLISRIPAGLEELVFMTDQHATSTSSDPWGGSIGIVYTKMSQFGDYVSDPALTSRAQSIYALFEDDQVMKDLTKYRAYFPSQYLNAESTKNPFGKYWNGDGYYFYNDHQLKTFDEFQLFSKIRELDYDFENCTALERITLPASIERIGYYAFSHCGSLGTIRISADSVPVLDRDAFRDLPADFQIIVPKTHVKRYRELWDQYADHIVGEDEVYRNGLIEVTLTEPNTLAEKLGLTAISERIGTYDDPLDEDAGPQPLYAVTSISGDYSHIRALKVNGPIGCADFTVMRFLAGYDIRKDINQLSPFGEFRNYFGRLEYIDLYNADIEPTNYLTDATNWQMNIKFLTKKEDDVLPGFALARCYSLKTVILPRTVKRVKERAFQESHYLETLVIGDDCEDFNWNSLDDCASMTRMYILSKKKMEMGNECWLYRAVCNNYSPTFDAFYVRPSLYQEYISDDAYTGSFQRTNNISTGAFKDDESFAAFASHAAATKDDLRQIGDVSGWFRHHPGITDLDALQYTIIDSLRIEDVAPLTKMRSVTLPATIKGVGKDAFKNATDLRYVDMSQCADYVPTLVSEGGVRSLGVGENTLAYVPAQYGETADVNVAVQEAPGAMMYKAKTVRLYDGNDYVMPYGIFADKVENTRTLTKSDAPYTVCLPYTLDIPEGAVAYRLKDRQSDELVFIQTDEAILEEGLPYLIRSTGNVSLNANSMTMLMSDNQTRTSQQSVAGYTLRGTLQSIGNAEACELGAYVLQSDGKWHAVLTDTEEHRRATIPAYRCYLLQSRVPGARTISMALGDDTTGIDRIRTIDTDGTERVYDLNGRLVGGNAKGIVIKSGKKIMNK